MKKVPQIFLALLFSFFCFANAFAGGDEPGWRPVSPEELAMKTPKVEPDADAEAIFWEVRLDDKNYNKMSYDHYVRVKIFTERGRERFSKMDIPFTKGKKVEDVAARVIKPDGTIVELKPEDIFEREIVKTGKVKVLAKSFAVPGIEPGVIVEYRYKETFKGDSASGERLVFQRDIPMERVSYYVRPYKGTSLKYNYFNMSRLNFAESTDGFYVGTMTDVPAIKDEPYMPPDNEVRSWVYLSYNTNGDLYNWLYYSRLYGPGFGIVTKPSKEIKQKAEELTANAATNNDKLKRIYDFAQKQIKNVTFDPAMTDDQRKDIKNKDAESTLKRGVGDLGDINFLFASLAKAAGFEVNLVFSGNRSEEYFTPERYPTMQFVHLSSIAVRDDSSTKSGELSATKYGAGEAAENWSYFNPGTPYLPFGKVNWYEEIVYSMLINEGGGFSWRKVPLSDYNQSNVKRSGKFKLLEDGTLEGTVRLEYAGQQAISRRRIDYLNSADKREKSAKEETTEHIKTAEISNVAVENFNDNSQPLVYSYQVRVPNYAQKTGKRLFLQPGFFEYGVNPVFSSATRRNSIYFPYPWSENDEITIEFPKNFQPENAETPAPIKDTQKIAALDIGIAIDKATNTLVYKRRFYFGGNGNIFFPATAYQPLKSLFDSFHNADSHTITLRQQ